MSESEFDILLSQSSELVESDPEIAFKMARRAASAARVLGKKSDLARIDAIRTASFGKMHKRIPSKLASPAFLILPVLTGYALLYLSEMYFYSEDTVESTLIVIGSVLVTLFSHSFGHSVTAKLFGIKLNGFYVAGRSGFEPTLLMELVSYYSASAKERFWLHVSGALSTVISIGVLTVMIELGNYLFAWKIISLLLLAGVLLVEALNSTKRGDLARAKRELRKEAI